jgi:hypothetical protein
MRGLAWRLAVGAPLFMTACLLRFHLVAWVLAPRAAGVALVPAWRLAWHSLAWDDRYPTPPAGTYCDATLRRGRLHVGPVEIRYSHAD